MPISSNVFVRSTALLLFIGFVALVAIVGTTLWLVQQNSYYFDLSTEARVARSVTVNLRNALQEAETSQRGFLLTGEESYLATYEQALPGIPEQVEQLAGMLARYPGTEDSIALMRTAVADKMAELAQTIELTRQNRPDEAIQIVLTDHGKESMDRARELFDAILEEADRRIISGLNNQRSATTGLRWVTIIGAFIIFAVVGGSAWAVMTYTRELAKAREEIQVANASLESRVRERTSELGRANEEIQRFAYIVTHDLRAPLVNIMGFTAELESSVATLSDYMQGKTDDPAVPKFKDAKLAATEDLPEAIGFIRAATRKMDGLINAILKISREGRRQLRPEQVNLAELVEGSIAAVQHQLSENGGEAVTDVKVPRLVSDRLSLEQVLGNLLDNAVKYQQPSRPLSVQVRARPAAGNRIEIEVEDNGRGIAATDHERVFELFRRSGVQSKPGEGIGLAHVRTIVRSLGGDITLRSTLGEGTTFIVTLPRDLRSQLGNQA